MYSRIKLDYNTLIPYIDNKTLMLHYNVHYKNYVNKLNELLNENEYDYRYELEELVNHIDIFNINSRSEILYNLGGVLNHQLYFYTMSLDGKKIPTGILLEKIKEEYNDYDNFKKIFKENVLSLKGSGYTMLTISPTGSLFILNTSNQDSPIYYGYYPILAIDIWEHAYYLKYNNRKEEYIDAWFNLIDYDKVERLYKKNI